MVNKRGRGPQMVTSSVIPKSVQIISGRVGAFAAIGFFGYLVDAGITYLCAKYLNLSPELARPPGFVIATLMTSFLTEQSHSETPRRVCTPRWSVTLWSLRWASR